MNKKPATTPIRAKKDKKILPIVAIGASAGGIEAMTELLQHLPQNTGMAYVYVQHLSPTHESMLTTILERATKMKVMQAEQNMVVGPNCLYIIPPNKNMTLMDGMLVLTERTARPGMNMPIDEFFISLAENYPGSAIGIVLSGNASDGTLGLKAIKASGGFTFAQNESARFRSMPRSAIAEGVVDLVLPPAEIAVELERLARQSIIIKVMQDGNVDDIDNNDEDLVAILQLLKRVTNVDFAHYKMRTIKRRILRRMLIYKLVTLKDYAQYLRQQPSEVNTLYQDLLINVTSFFRDPDAVEYLKKTVLPQIIKDKSAKEPIRIWVPACSTGEEAYSIAIICAEILEDAAVSASIQIFATDLSDSAIAKARLGIYTKSEVAEVSAERLERFFTRIDGSYRIGKNIRDLCVFAPHNIFRDPPFSRLDLISCCNLMIYLDTVLQKKIFGTFHYALNANGYLMLGKSETIGASAQLFSQLDKKFKIYVRKTDANSLEVFESDHRLPSDDRTAAQPIQISVKTESRMAAGLEKLVDTTLLTKYIPPSVVVNQDLEILQFRGGIGAFLEPAPGKASLNLLKMARPGLALELRNAIHRCGKTGQPVKRPGLEVRDNENKRYVTIKVEQLKSEAKEKLFLVVFEDVTDLALPDTRSTYSKDKLVKQLQEELNAVREDMRSIIESQETSNEELQSANEEIVSSNEELQSINEELETSKEEIESTNEELMTINTELQVRNEQLTEAYEYAEAVFSTIREGLLVLDASLRVRSANQAFYKIFRVNEGAVEGLLVYELGNGQWNIPRLRELLEDVIPRNIEFKGFEVTHTFQHIGKKCMLLNARRVIQRIHRQQLILLAIEDITDHRDAEEAATGARRRFNNIVDNVPVLLWASGADKQFNFVNRTWLDFTGRTAEQERGSGWLEGMHPDDVANWMKIYNASFDEKKPFNVQYRLRYHDGNYKLMQNCGRPAYLEDGTFAGYTGSCVEIRYAHK